MDFSHEYTDDIRPRFKYLKWIVGAVFIIISARLYYLQVTKGNYYRFFSEQNSIKELKLPALRGMIFDKDGQILVDNRPAFDVVVIPQYIKDREKTISTLVDLIKVPPEDIVACLDKSRGMPSYHPIVIKPDVGMDDVSSVRAYKTPWYDDSDKYDLRGIDVQMRYARTYSDGILAPHLLGYLREIDPERLKKYSELMPDRYQIGDFTGIGGVEEVWDNVLRGMDGYDQRVVNAMGRQVDWPDIELIHEEPKYGAAVYLTIDADLQKVAKDALKDKSGAVAALDPNTGAVLALYSAPPYDLNEMSSQMGGEYWKKIAGDPRRILYNRAIQGTYPPGSTYKIVTATSGLEEDIIDQKSTFFCPGGLNYGGRFYQCWRKGGHGIISVQEAITASCDTFFYQLGLKTGVDVIAKYANLLGLGHLTGIDILGEKSGLIPTSEWKEKTLGVKWQMGENLSIAIGQGYDTVTPLQNAVMISTIANNGKKVVPHVVAKAVDLGGNEIYSWRGSVGSQVIDPEKIKVVRLGLQGVVDSTSGTAHFLNSLGLKIAGKTGTAQVVAKEVWRGGVAEMKDHAWFVGYAPYDKPEIAIAVLVEHGGFGASAAAPVVGNIMKKYFEKKNEKAN